MATKYLQTIILAVSIALPLGASADPLPSFTFNPAAVGLLGTQFTADNLLISDYATVQNTPTGFQETGYLAITGVQSGSSTASLPGGLNSTYGLYVQFSVTGSAAGSFTSGGTTFYGGVIDSISYTLYGYNGTGSFTPTSAPVPSITLGTGTLVSGSFSGTIAGGKVTSASSSIDVTFTPTTEGADFFVGPNPFYHLAQASFSNTSLQIASNLPVGFTVTQGGGSINFVAAPVPEPETYAMLVAGLGVVATMVVRRRRRNG